MKLYATTRTERAQKGQGGNKFLEVVHSVEHENGDRDEVVRLHTVREGAEFVLSLTVESDTTTYRVPIRKA